MTREQVLDVGDAVVITRKGWSAQQATIIKQQPGGDYSVYFDSSSGSGVAIIHRSELTRCGRDLQPGDWVNVKGYGFRFDRAGAKAEEIEGPGIILDEDGSDSDLFVIYMFETVRLFNVRTRHLSRTTKAEALA